MNALPPHPHVPRQPEGLQAWPGWVPPRPPQVRPARAWYGLAVSLLLCGALFTGLGAVIGIFADIGKQLTCDATTACDKRPGDVGYQHPAWPLWPFVTGAVLAFLAVVAFLVVFVVRRRRIKRAGPVH